MGKMKEFMVEQEDINMETLNFGWGDTRGLRKKILFIYNNLNVMQTMPLETYGYPPYEGDLELVDMLRKLTKMLTGKSYKHICVTAGCTHAVNASIYALADNSKTQSVNTRKLYYPRYPSMIKLTPYIHQTWDFYHTKHCIVIVDSPSNPLGLIGHDQEFNTDRVIWDAAYHTPTYGMTLGTNNVNHKVFCGSLSKLTGINGIRLGWTATDEDEVNRQIQLYTKSSVCGISYPSQYVAKEILKDEDRLHMYFLQSKALIDNNREEVLKLKHIFGQDYISPFGMFAFFRTDDRMEEIFKKAKVEFTPGSECGADFQAVRINLANPNEMTQQMVQRIIKADKTWA